MGVSKNNGTPKSSILIGFSIINHPLWGTPIFGNIHISRYYITMSYTSHFSRTEKQLYLLPGCCFTKKTTRTQKSRPIQRWRWTSSSNCRLHCHMATCWHDAMAVLKQIRLGSTFHQGHLPGNNTRGTNGNFPGEPREDHKERVSPTVFSQNLSISHQVFSSQVS